MRSLFIVAVLCLALCGVLASAQTVKQRIRQWERTAKRHESRAARKHARKRHRQQQVLDRKLGGSVSESKRSLRKIRSGNLKQLRKVTQDNEGSAGNDNKKTKPRENTLGGRIEKARNVLNAFLAPDAAFNLAFDRAKKNGHSDDEAWRIGQHARKTASPDFKAPALKLEELGKMNRDGRREVVDEDGRRHLILSQDKGNSCLAACVTMTLWARGCDGATQNDGQQRIAREEMQYLHGEKQGKAMVSDRHAGKRDWELRGTFLPLAARALQSKPCGNGETEVHQLDSDNGKALRRALKAATPTEPIIVVVEWFGGGGHAALCIGLNKAKDKILFLDPIYGLLYKPVTSHPTAYFDQRGTKRGKLRFEVIGVDD